jgi:hypothetical protein
LHAIVGRVQNENGRTGDEDVGGVLQLILSCSIPSANDLYGCCGIGTNDDDAMIGEVGDVESVITDNVNAVVGVEKR